MRISDWSSDVCSSDLEGDAGEQPKLDVAQGEIDLDRRQQHRQRHAVDMAQHMREEEHRHDVSAISAPRRSPRHDGFSLRQRGFSICRFPRLRVRRHRPTRADVPVPSRSRFRPSPIPRSEEHTSELQSLMRISYAVFCLKKKKKPKTDTYTIQ